MSWKRLWAGLNRKFQYQLLFSPCQLLYLLLSNLFLHRSYLVSWFGIFELLNFPKTDSFAFFLVLSCLAIVTYRPVIPLVSFEVEPGKYSIHNRWYFIFWLHADYLLFLAPLPELFKFTINPILIRFITLNNFIAHNASMKLSSRVVLPQLESEPILFTSLSHKLIISLAEKGEFFVFLLQKVWN